MASAQIKSAVLLAGLAAPGVTTVIETEASRDHTEMMLAHFGAEIVSSARRRPRPQDLAAAASRNCAAPPVVVPADPSSAAFPLVAALLVAGLRHACSTDVMTNPLRTGLFATLREMGAADRGEPTPAATPASRWPNCACAPSQLRGVEVPPERAPSMIDEYLVLAVAAAFAEGTTIMRGLKELRVKESDRLAAHRRHAARQRRRRSRSSGDDLIVEGRGHVPGGGLVATHMDHRIAMSALVMGLAGATAGADRRRRLHRHQLSRFRADDAAAWAPDLS